MSCFCFLQWTAQHRPHPDQPGFEPILINLCFHFLLPPLLAAKLDGVKTYMRMRRVPNHLQVKVIKWFDYLWLTQKCSDEERAVSCLPDKLKVSYVQGFCNKKKSKLYVKDGSAVERKEIGNVFKLCYTIVMPNSHNLTKTEIFNHIGIFCRSVILRQLKRYC